MGFEWPDCSSASGAVIDGNYRYLLWRSWPSLEPQTPPLFFLMANPSVADSSIDDPTIRRCLGFARRERASGIRVVNLCAFRATDPKALVAAAKAGGDVIGPLNEQYIRTAASFGPIVAAWGRPSGPFMKARAAYVSALLKAWGVEARCLGKTDSGQPRHPLMLPSATIFEAL